jgi:hypothetical protein
MNKKTLIIASLLLTLSLNSAVALIPTTKVLGATSTISDDDSYQDFHIDKYGKVTIRQAKVFQVAGTTYYLRYYVGTAFLRILLKTDDKTKVYRKFGDEITLDQIKAGDILNIDGTVETGSDTLSVVATKISNFSNQKAVSSFTGTIVGTGSTYGSFVLKTKNDTITINTGTTTQIRKGNRIITPDLVRNGDQIVDTAGTFDYATKTLDARVVQVYVDMKTFNARNFEGKLKSVNNSGELPTLVVSTEGKDYRVFLKKPLIILNKAKNPVSIKRYLEGDTVRVYGAIREAEEPIIDAEVVRNVDLQ